MVLLTVSARHPFWTLRFSAGVICARHASSYSVNDTCHALFHFVFGGRPRWHSLEQSLLPGKEVRKLIERRARSLVLREWRSYVNISKRQRIADNVVSFL